MNMPITENIYTKDLETVCKEEVRECDKHDIIAEMTTFMGNCPSSFAVAEQIFDQMKFSIAQYVMKHECDTAFYSNEKMHFEIEEKANPAALEKLNEVIEQYLL